MRDLKTIEKRIEELNKKKKDLITKQGEGLYRKIQPILGQDFSVELASAILFDTWQKADPKQKESWQSLAASFRPKRNNRFEPKDQKTRAENAKIAVQKTESSAHA